MALADPRLRRRSSRGTIVRLNQGSSPFGVRTSFPLNTAGGTFGSGHPAGGGAGAGVTLAQALLSPAASVQGPAPAVGPPPVPVTNQPAPPALSNTQTMTPYYTPPSFSPHPVVVKALAGLYPTFNPRPSYGVRAY